jgi:hypothetical protein
MASQEEKKKSVEDFVEMSKYQGVSVRVVSDGHVFSFQRGTLEAWLKNHPTEDSFMVFVKHGMPTTKRN